MPRIPVYNTPQVQLTPVPGSRLNVQTPLIAPSNAVAQGLASISDAMGKAREEADIIRAEEAFNLLRQKQTELGYGEKGAFNVKGGNVFNREQPFGQEYTGRFDAESQAIMDGLANDNQKRIFQRASGRARIEFGGQLARHEMQQGAAYREGVFKGVLEAEKEQVAINFNDADSVAQSIQRVSANTRSYAQSQGVLGEQQDLAVKEAVSGLHVLVMDRKLKGDATRNIAPDPVGAKAYYQQAVKDGVVMESSKAAQQMRELIEKDERQFRANTAVDAIWKGFGPDSDTEAVNLDAMTAELRTQFKNDPDGFKLALSDLKERASTHDYSVRQRESKTAGGIYERVLAGESLSSIRKSEEFRSLDGTRQIDMVQKIEAFQKRGNETDNLNKFAEYWAVASNPQRLSKMSDAEIFAMAPKIGATLVKQLLSSKVTLANNAAKTEEKVIAATVDVDMFKSVARAAGLDTSNKTGSDGDNLLGDLKYRVEKLIDVEQRTLGRALKYEEKEAIMKRLMVQVPVMENRSFLGLRTGTTITNKRLFEVQYPENIVVPAPDRAVIIKRLQEAGIEKPTEAQIRNGYIRLKVN